MKFHCRLSSVFCFRFVIDAHVPTFVFFPLHAAKLRIWRMRTRIWQVVVSKMVQLQQEDSRTLLAIQRDVRSRYHSGRTQPSHGQTTWIHTQMHLQQSLLQNKCSIENPSHKETNQWWLQMQTQSERRYTGWLGNKVAEKEASTKRRTDNDDGRHGAGECTDSNPLGLRVWGKWKL